MKIQSGGSPLKGQRKYIFGFLIFNLGLLFLLDTMAYEFSFIVIAVGFVMFLYGHIENFLYNAKLKRKTKNDLHSDEEL